MERLADPALMPIFKPEFGDRTCGSMTGRDET